MPTSGSPWSSGSPRRRSRPTSGACWPSSAWPTARRPRCWPYARAWSRGLKTNFPWKPGPGRAYVDGMSTAIITGASRGLGLALARALADRGWRLVLDARGREDLERSARELGRLTEVTAIPGDVSDPAHREALIAAAGPEIDLLVNNASVLGPSPQPTLNRYPLSELEHVYEVNVLAPLALTQLALRRICGCARGTIINITS